MPKCHGQVTRDAGYVKIGRGVCWRLLLTFDMMVPSLDVLSHALTEKSRLVYETTNHQSTIGTNNNTIMPHPAKCSPSATWGITGSPSAPDRVRMLRCEQPGYSHTLTTTKMANLTDLQHTVQCVWAAQLPPTPRPPRRSNFV